MRLKLYLSLVWISARAPHQTEFPARSWAEALGLDDPDGNGLRRVNEALAWLDRNQFVRIEKQPGRPARVFVREETGSGKEYVAPWDVRDTYIKVPKEFWQHGWQAMLSGAAVALLLVILDHQFSYPGAFWLSPLVRRERYSLSDETWKKGTAELERFGIVYISKIPVDEAFAFRRVRNLYSYSSERIRFQVDLKPGL